MIHYSNTKDIPDAQLRALYESVGWTAYTEEFEDLAILLNNTQLVYTAWNAEELVGLIRTIGDGVYIQYIQDILVKPDFQRRGIGTELLQRVLSESNHIRQVILTTGSGPEDKSVRDWYKEQGLTEFRDAELAGFTRLDHPS